MASFNLIRLKCLFIAITIILTGCGGGGADASNTNNGGFTTTNTKPQISSEASAAVSSIVSNVNNAENQASSTSDSTSSAASDISSSQDYTSSAESEFSSVASSANGAVSSQISSSSVSKTQSSKLSTSSSSSSKSSLSSSRSSLSSSRSSSSSSRSSSSRSTTSFDTTPPTQPDAFTTQLVRYDIVILKWDQATDNVAVAFYNLYRDGVLLDRLPGTENIYYDYDIASSRSYTYSITAGDAAGNWSPLSLMDVKTPSLPTNSSVASSAPSTSAASSIASASSINSLSSSISVSSVSSSISVSSASSIDSASSSSASASSKAPFVDIITPTSPGDVLKLHASTTQVDISWTVATDNVGVTAYRVYRDGALLKTFSADVFTYSDKTVAPDTSYWFGVSAGDAAGNWSLQKLISIKTPPVSGAGMVTLQWEPPTQRENGNALLSTEIGGYDIRYKTPQESSFHYLSANKLDRQMTISNLKGENTFQVAVFDTNGRYSYFATIEPK